MVTGQTGSGLRYAVKKSVSPVAYCSLSIKCGTRDEGDFHSGIAHFAEHTIFKGTDSKSSKVINNYLDRLGGELNAFTTKEEIVIHATVLREDLRKAVSLLMELALRPVFPKDEIEVERGVVIDEINSYKDSPADDVYDKFEEALFAGHPLGKSILGTAASIKRITSGELREFTRKHFTPGNMALAIVADIDEKKMEDAVLKLSEKIFDGGLLESPERKTAAVDGTIVFNKRVDKRNHEVNAVIGATAPSVYETRDRFSTILLANILGGPASNSLLNALLREKNGWVYGVEASYSQYTETGILCISLGCEKANLDRCLGAVSKVISKLQEDQLSPTRLKAAKRQLLGQLAISSDNGETQCLSMGKSLLAFGTVHADGRNREAIEAVGAEDLQRIARKTLAPERLSSLIFI